MSKRIFLIMVLVFFAGVCLAEENFIYGSKGKRDPFMPLVTSQGYIVSIEDELFASDMNLEGIIFDNQSQGMAIINGKVVKIGDNIGSYTVLQIEAKKVVLSKDAERFVLELKKEE